MTSDMLLDLVHQPQPISPSACPPFSLFFFFMSSFIFLSISFIFPERSPEWSECNELFKRHSLMRRQRKQGERMHQLTSARASRKRRAAERACTSATCFACRCWSTAARDSLLACTALAFSETSCSCCSLQRCFCLCCSAAISKRSRPLHGGARALSCRVFRVVRFLPEGGPTVYSLMSYL
jgi:hypothetical protein